MSSNEVVARLPCGISRRKVDAGVFVHIKAVGATAELGAVSAAGHGAITRRCRSSAISEGSAAVYKKQDERSGVET